MDDGREDKNPWTKWYWAEYRAADGLRLCSLAAQGLWMRMLSVMATSTRKGYLLLNGKAVSPLALASLANSGIEEIQILITELRSRKVFSETRSGLIFNRRMARESRLSEIRAKAGARGGRAKNQGEITPIDDKQTESKLKAKVKQDVKAPSASAYASASISASNKNLISEIVSYLNERTGKNFSDKSKSTIGFISGRLAEGRTLEDFKGVIDLKVTQWTHKPEMAPYLRPETLFNASKFEAYLNERPLVKIDDGKAWAIKKTAEMRAKGELDD